MATVDKNFRIKNGLAVEGTTATVNGNNILTENTQAGDSYIINLIGGSADTANTPNTVVKRDGNGNFAAGTITATFIGDVTGTVSSLSNHSTSDLAEGSNLYFTNQRAIDAGDGVFDGFGAASAAQTAAELTALGYAQTAETNAAIYTSAQITQEVTDRNNAITSALTTAQGYADTAEQDAKDYADDLINDASTSSTEVWSAYKTSTEIGLAQAAAELHADNAIAGLVGSAPDLLDTIHELATALENNPDIIADLQDVAAGKQDTLTAGSNIDITGDTISVTGLDTDDVAEGTNLYFTNQRAIDAVGGSATSDNTPDTVVKRDGSGNFAANTITASRVTYGEAGYVEDDASLIITATNSDLRLNAADDIRMYAQDDITIESVSGQITLDVPNGEAFIGVNDAENKIATEGHVQSNITTAVSNLTDGNTEFTKVAIGWMSDEVASYVNAPDGNSVTAYSWNKYEGASAKFLVRVRNGIHSQISEVLLTRDNADNIAITEYGIVTTNGILADITAVVSGSNINLNVDPIHEDGTEIIVAGTLMNYGD